MLTLAELRKKAAEDPNVNVIISDSGIEQFRRPAQTRRNLVHSVAKSVTAIGFGFAMQEGYVSLQESLADAFAQELSKVKERFADHFGSEAAEAQLERLKEIKLSHLLSHTSGFRDNILTGFERPYLKEDDWTVLSLSVPVIHAPGEVFFYADENFYLLAKLVQRRTRQNLSAYLLPRLFSPIGLRWPTWEADPDGDAIGCGGLLLSLDELHTLGLLCQNFGSWSGETVVEEAWMRTVTTEKVPFGDGCGYGYGFWTAPDCYYMFGLGGVYSFIAKEGGLLISADGLNL